MTFQPTKPRGPIAAMYGSPGPVYNLPPLIGYPNHSSSSKFQRNPAYSFGLRSATDKSDKSPGPCHNIPQRLYCTGMDGIPSYSITSRPRDLTVHSTPGPGNYSKENSDKSVYRKCPAYTMTGRHPGREVDDIPAPNVYALPPAIGKTVLKKQCPMFSITGRSKIGGIAEDLTKTPGPGAYNVGTADGHGVPCYSIVGRNQLPGDTTVKPGPGAYNVNAAYQALGTTRSYSFGHRHSQYMTPVVLDADNDC